MEYLTPIKQNKLFGLNKFFNELIYLYKKNNLPNKILLSGQKGIGKSTFAYHFIQISESYPGRTGNIFWRLCEQIGRSYPIS